MEKASQNTKTIGVTTSSGYMPSNGAPMCELPDGFIEYGMGFNGEPGYVRKPLASADEIVETLMKELLYEIPHDSEVAFMVNGYGFTSMLELLIVSRNVCKLVEQSSMINAHTFIYTLFSPQGTGGFSISAMILDEELKQLYQSKCYSPMFRFQGGI